jgi:hypothetical protein
MIAFILPARERQPNIGLTCEPSSAPALPRHYQVNIAAIYDFSNASQVEAIVGNAQN